MVDLSPTIKAVQRTIGVTADGIAGPLTWAAIAGKVGAEVTRSQEDDTAVVPPDIDPRSAGNIATLNPVVRPLAVQLIRDCAASGFEVRVISGYRTFEEQAVLRAKYEAGGPKAARPGYSNHNYAFAFDIGVFINGQYKGESPLYYQAGLRGKKLGLIWGGDWGGGDEDPPHFEYRPEWAKDLTEGQAIAAYRQRQASGKALV